MRIQVHLFARAKDLAGAEIVTLDVPEELSAKELRRHLVETVPKLTDLLPRCAVAVNNEFAEEDTPIPANAEVAVLPPVSGG